METQIQIVETADGSLTLTHGEHGECYHSRQGAAAEAMDLYGKASGYAETVVEGRDLTILDVGLGLGYNAVTTIDLWQRAEGPGSLRLVSLEIDGSLVKDLASGEASWQRTWSPAWKLIATSLVEIEPTLWRSRLTHPCGAQLEWDVEIRDMRREPLPARARDLDFIWQDPFSPAKNPDLWSRAWFARLRPRVAPSCRLVTYSVARAVRDALEHEGWVPQKIPAEGMSKRHWLLATPE